MDSSRETYEYDLVGNMITAIDGENHGVKYGYNCWSRTETVCLLQEPARRV